MPAIARSGMCFSAATRLRLAMTRLKPASEKVEAALCSTSEVICEASLANAGSDSTAMTMSDVPARRLRAVALGT
jgi:hypothetical protein